MFNKNRIQQNSTNFYKNLIESIKFNKNKQRLTETKFLKFLPKLLKIFRNERIQYWQKENITEFNKVWQKLKGIMIDIDKI